MFRQQGGIIMAKKKKIAKTNAIREVERQKISMELREYPWSEDHLEAKHVAQALGEDLHRIYKTIVTVGKDTGPVVAVLPGDCELDLKKLAKVSHNKKVELLHLKDLEATTGYIRGGCSPVGMKKHYPTYIAKEALEGEMITISAGRRGLQMKLNPNDLANLVSAEFVDIIAR